MFLKFADSTGELAKTFENLIHDGYVSLERHRGQFNFENVDLIPQKVRWLTLWTAAKVNYN